MLTYFLRSLAAIWLSIVLLCFQLASVEQIVCAESTEELGLLLSNSLGRFLVGILLDNHISHFLAAWQEFFVARSDHSVILLLLHSEADALLLGLSDNLVSSLCRFTATSSRVRRLLLGAVPFNRSFA